MSEFQLYFELGKDHILDYANGYDHILLWSLCARYILSGLEEGSNFGNCFYHWTLYHVSFIDAQSGFRQG